jgi:DNA-binding CsgD family transcriptional regulator
MASKTAKVDRNQRILDGIAAGDTYQAIALREGITKARVQQIAKREGVARRAKVAA